MMLNHKVAVIYGAGGGIGGTVALLTIYDMCKAVDKEMAITEVQLAEKTKQPVPGGVME